MSKPLSKPVSQARSRQTRDRLVQALESLLRRKDFDEITISDLAGEAGVAVGTVYRRFENKQALIPLLFELWESRNQTHLASARLTRQEAETADLRSLLRAQFRTAHRFASEQAHILRAIHLHGRLSPGLISDDWKRLWDTALQGMRQFLDIAAHRIARRDLDRAARMIVYQANTALVEKLIFGDSGAGHVMKTDGDAFADEMADLIFGYLQTPES
jgi:AcrR family transcriptional regulator